MGMGIGRRYVRQSISPGRDPAEPKYYVYRLTDASGVVLYIGRSADPRRRLAQHRATSEWAMSATDMETWGPFTWVDACARERAHIEADRPPHNRMFVTPES